LLLGHDDEQDNAWCRQRQRGRHHRPDDATAAIRPPAGFDPTIWTEDSPINNGLSYLINNPPAE
jgi:hypothetical protein